MKINPYLSFGGNCAEAVMHYEKAFGVKATVEMCTQIKGNVAHAEFQLDGHTIMLFDSHEAVAQGDNVMLSILFDKGDIIRAQKIFDALGAGGQIIMPMGKTDWSECFGLIKDKFGITWNMCQN